MAELASGAVSSLLSLLRNEALLLSRVGSDVEFIKEEMEGMYSFLEHLARTAPPVGGHDEQVRTWMKQVQDLAHDCSNCVDLYIRRGDREVYRARAGRWRYLWWASWLVQKLVAQHNAAVRLGELKERARDVGKRRLRYGVEIPRKVAAVGETGAAAGTPPPGLSLPSSSSSSRLLPTATGDDDDDDDDEKEDQNQGATAADASDRLQRAQEPRVLEEYCEEKLANWVKMQVEAETETETEMEVSMASIAIVVPEDPENSGAWAIAHRSLARATTHFTCKVWINLPEVHLPWDLTSLDRWEILAYVLRDCETKQQAGTVHDKESNKDSKLQAYRYKDDILAKILETVDGSIQVEDKIEQLKKKIGEVDGKKVEADTKRLMTQLDKRLVVLLHALQLGQNVPAANLPLSMDEALEDAARMLQVHMKSGNSDDEPPICLSGEQYKDILRKAFPSSKLPKQPQAHAIAASLHEDHIKEIILESHKITLGIIRDLLPNLQLLAEGNSSKEQAATLQGGCDQVPNSVSAAATEKMEEISAEVKATSSASATDISETKENMDRATVAAIKETNEKMEISGEVKAAISETKEKMDEIMQRIRCQLVVNGTVDRIRPHLKNKTLIILQDDEDYVSTEANEYSLSPWEDTRNALNLLGCAPGSAVIVSTKNTQKAKELCHPTGEPVTCSLVGLYYDIALQFTGHRVKNGDDGYNAQILRDILDRCHLDEFCMQVFVHSLYANPNRNYEDLLKLHQDLLVPQRTLGSNTKKMLKFSYNDLSRDYKTCLLYLAIFPQGHNMRRSTLTGRWVTEGLITKQDWRTTVSHAERCFDALIKRGFVLPHDIGAAGKVKSCIVGDQVHGFITKIANKQHILDARLSDQWARFFSIFSGLRVRTSDSIDNFVHKLPKYSPQLPLLKFLDLEGTRCFDKSRYLKDICKKILLLRYLSLRRTNVSHLPSEINNLHELEVLDIRQTKVPEDATRHVLLLKLRRFLADRMDESSGMNGNPLRSAVRIPWKIKKMENLEVLSNARASRAGNELKDISHLWQLRKLGVVIEDREDHLCNLFPAINDLSKSLFSLSITISTSRTKHTPSSKQQKQKDMPSPSTQTPSRHLESLTINGVRESGQLLESLAKDSNSLAKVTLSGTFLKKESLIVLAVLPKLRCVRLRTDAYTGSMLTFKKEEFQHLKYFLVEGTNNRKINMTQTDIMFEEGATAELEKIVLSFTNISSLGGVDNLPKLKELELENNEFLHSFSHDRAAHEENTDESRLLEQSTDNTSKVPMQNIDSRASEQNIESSAAPEQNMERRGADQNAQRQSSAPDQENVKRRETDEQNTQRSSVFEEKTTTRATDDLNSQRESRASEQNPEIIAPEQDTEGRRFTFKKEKFQHLVYFCVKDSKMTNIVFEPGAAPKLKKMSLSLDDKRSKLTGISGLPKLKEVELKGEMFLLSFFKEADEVAKMTLRDTQLKQSDVEILAKKPNLCCLVLSDNSYAERQLTLSSGEFPKLDLLIVECRSINRISFEAGSAPNLEKIVWSFGEMKSLSGISNLLKLKEIECSGEHVPHQVRKEIATHKNQPILTQKESRKQGEEVALQERTSRMGASWLKKKVCKDLCPACASCP